MHRLSKIIGAVTGLTLSAFLLIGCDEVAADPQEKENHSRQSGYKALVNQQPAHKMSYSPTRATKNFWVDTWNKKGKLSYVYLLNANGDTIGYYVLVGLPVSYCTSLIPPYQIKEQWGNDVQDLIVPGPSVDGTFSSASNCNVFYGRDATNGAYIEYTTGQGINALVYDQPLPRFKTAQPLGFAEVK